MKNIYVIDTDIYSENYINSAIELFQDGYSKDAVSHFKKFNKACKDELALMKKQGLAESVVNEKDDAGDHLDKLAELVGKAKDFMSVGKELKAGKYKYDFGTGMMPHYQVEADGFTFMIVNKRYVDKGDREVNDIAIGLLENIKTQTTNMENTFSIHESFASFTGASGFINEKLGSQLLASVLMSNKEGKYGKQNLKSLAGGFYQLAKVSLDKVGDEDMIISNDPTKVFKEHGGSKHILFFISDNEKENPYTPYDAGYGAIFLGNGKNQFTYSSSIKTGIYLPEDTRSISAININKNAGSVIHNAKILAEVFVILSLGKENCRTPFW